MADSPATRAELIEVMARAIYEASGIGIDWEDMNPIPYRVDAEVALTAIEAAGCSVVPNEATNMMLLSQGGTRQWDDCREDWALWLVAAPFKPTKEG